MNVHRSCKENRLAIAISSFVERLQHAYVHVLIHVDRAFPELHLNDVRPFRLGVRPTSIVYRRSEPSVWWLAWRVASIPIRFPLMWQNHLSNSRRRSQRRILRWSLVHRLPRGGAHSKVERNRRRRTFFEFAGGGSFGDSIQQAIVANRLLQHPKTRRPARGRRWWLRKKRPSCYARRSGMRVEGRRRHLLLGHRSRQFGGRGGDGRGGGRVGDRAGSRGSPRGGDGGLRRLDGVRTPKRQRNSMLFPR